MFIFEVVKAHVATSPKYPKTIHYRGDGEFMISGANTARYRRLFRPEMLWELKVTRRPGDPSTQGFAGVTTVGLRSFSEGATPGPTPRPLILRTTFNDLHITPLPVVMGPGVRRDDIRSELSSRLLPPRREIFQRLLVSCRVKPENAAALSYFLGDKILERGHLEGFIGNFVGDARESPNQRALRRDSGVFFSAIPPPVSEDLLRSSHRRSTGRKHPRGRDPAKCYERRRFRNFSRNRPEITNLNHQYVIRRVFICLSSMPGVGPPNASKQ